MIVYHGSNSNFSKLRISRDLVHWEKERTHADGITFRFMPLDHTEDVGIYFSADKETAKQYGKYVYTLEINDCYIKDFRGRTACRMFLAKMAQEIYKKIDVDLLEYVNLEHLSEKMYWHTLCISTIYTEFEHIFFNSSDFNKLPKSKRDRISQMIRAICKRELTVILFNADNRDEGIIKKVDDSIVRIISKEQLY